ncbi:MAG: DNA internalization-related competence protein ComEC/Rec2 [Arenicella sp.]|nr:DNA internalization-related competence protein ComEC/Rec2 [Arenicella sp.]
MPLRLVAAVVFGFAYAAWQFNSHLAQTFPADLERQSIRVVGQVTGLPDSNSQRVRFRFEVTRFLPRQLNDPAAQRIEGQRLQLTCYRCELDFQAGQQWILTVRLKQPHAYASWGAFDYEKYLFRHRIVATGYVRPSEQNQLLAHSRAGMTQLRQQIDNQLRQLLPSHVAGRGVLAALMIGDRSSLSSTDREALQKTGLSHLMAISGLHIGLVFLVTRLLMGWLLMPFSAVYHWQPRQFLVLLPALAAAFAYAGLAGFSVSTRRALIMLATYALCRLLARDTRLNQVLLISASLILLLDPFSVLDIGFWLSCGAVLIIAARVDGPATVSLPRLQFALWVGMAPLVVIFFGQVPLISPLLNLLMVPAFCIVLIPLTLFALLLLLFDVADMIPWLLVYLADIFAWILHILDWISQHPALQWYPPPLGVADYVMVTLTAAIYFGRLPLPRSVKLAVHIVLLVSLCWVPDNLKDGDVDITLLDVGQGLSMLFESKSAVIVYDTGPAYRSGFSAAKAVLIPLLRSRGIEQIDILVVSHTDNDHMGGLQEVINQFNVTHIMTSRAGEIPASHNCQAGQKWQVDSIRYSVIAPDETTPRSKNNNSCVLQVVAHGVTLLVTADIEAPAERHLVKQRGDLAADIMLVPHHGSNTSSSGSFLDAVAPRLALLSSGYQNRYGHPHKGVLRRYQERQIDLISTVTHGSIMLKIRRSGWHLTPFRITEKRFWRHQKKPTVNG